MTTGKHKNLFCSQPFRHFEVSWHPKRGRAFLCCPSWLPVPIGTLGQQSTEDVWNSSTAQLVRESILDGSFRFCRSNCPHLRTISGPVQLRDEIQDEYTLEILRSNRTTIEHPQVVNAAFDRSCNLSCPSCRNEHIVERDAARDIRNLQRQIETDVLPHAEILYVTGSGDPFASPFFLTWLRTLKVEDKPRLHIHLHTNAQLWTPNIWAKLPESVKARIHTAEISIDAASAVTYDLNRRGGNWTVLLENLSFISELRASGPLQQLKFHMLVQDNNFHELPAFVDIGKTYRADEIYFSHLADWGTFTTEELASRSVHLPNHPRHEEFLRMLKHPALKARGVNLGNLSGLTYQR